MARAGLKHWMLHNDQLANELDETLKLSPGYDPVRDVDPALTFHAPLLTGPDSIPGAIRAVIERNSEATYKAPRGAFLLSALDDESRHEYTADDEPLGVLMEPASTNKCENYNANPDAALSNINQIGDPAAIFSRVQDVEELAAAGLTAVCKSGFALKLDNSAGNSGAEIQFQGATGNLNDHAIIAYARIDPASTGAVEVKPTGQDGINVTGIKYERIVVPFTSTETSREAAFNCQAGGIGYVILNQLEESPVPTSIIVTEGAATSRAVDQLSWPLAGDAGPILNQAEGMAAILWRPSFDNALHAGSTISANILTLLGSQFIRWQRNADSNALFVIDGPIVDGTDQVAGGFVKDRNYLILARWTSANKQIGYKMGGIVSWGVEVAHTPPFGEDGNLYLASGARYAPEHMRDVYLWSEDRGAAWLESFFEGVAN